MDLLIQIIKLFILIMVLLIWSLIGFAFWVPLLARTTVVFSIVILQHTLSGQKPGFVARPLDFAIRFYIEGFKKIFEAMYHPQDQDGYLPFHWGRLLVEGFWTFFFWLLLWFLIDSQSLVAQLRRTLALF